MKKAKIYFLLRRTNKRMIYPVDFFLSFLLLFCSCQNHPPIEKETQDLEYLPEPHIYMSQYDKIITISEINRKESLLTLSDKFFFSNFKKTSLFPIENKKEKDEKKPVLSEFHKINPKNLKVRISTICIFSDEPKTKVILIVFKISGIYNMKVVSNKGG